METVWTAGCWFMQYHRVRKRVIFHSVLLSLQEWFPETLAGNSLTENLLEEVYRQCVSVYNSHWKTFPENQPHQLQWISIPLPWKPTMMWNIWLIQVLTVVAWESEYHIFLSNFPLSLKNKQSSKMRIIVLALKTPFHSVTARQSLLKR